MTTGGLGAVPTLSNAPASAADSHTFGEGAPESEVVSALEWETLVGLYGVVEAGAGAGDAAGSGSGSGSWSGVGSAAGQGGGEEGGEGGDGMAITIDDDGGEPGATGESGNGPPAGDAAASGEGGGGASADAGAEAQLGPVCFSRSLTTGSSDVRWAPHKCDKCLAAAKSDILNRRINFNDAIVKARARAGVGARVRARVRARLGWAWATEGNG